MREASWKLPWRIFPLGVHFTHQGLARVVCVLLSDGVRPSWSFAVFLVLETTGEKWILRLASCCTWSLNP